MTLTKSCLATILDIIKVMPSSRHHHAIASEPASGNEAIKAVIATRKRAIGDPRKTIFLNRFLAVRHRLPLRTAALAAG